MKKVLLTFLVLFIIALFSSQPVHNTYLIIIGSIGGAALTILVLWIAIKVINKPTK